MCTASHVSQFPSLNFLVYIPKNTESPLYIRPDPSNREEASLTDNFLVPQWGGVILYNDPGGLLRHGVDPNGTGAGGDDGGAVHLRVNMKKLMPVFIKQLKMLLGIPDILVSAVATR